MFVPFVDKRVGVQVKLRDPLATRVLRGHFYDKLPSRRDGIILCPTSAFPSNNARANVCLLVYS